MTKDGCSNWHEAVEISLREVFPCIKEVVVQNGNSLDSHSGLTLYARGMKSLNLEELAIELPEERQLIVKHVYENAYISIRYVDGASAADLSRHIRLLLSRKPEVLRANGKNYMAKNLVDTYLKRWERAIALTLGKRFASKIISRALQGRDIGAMSHEDMRNVHTFLATAIGGCLFFELEKVDK